MARTFTVKGRIEAEDAASGVVDSVSGKFASLTDTLGPALTKAIGLGLSFEALRRSLSATIGAASEQEDAIVALTSALKLAGPEALRLRQELIDQADALQRTTKFSDDAVESAQALLATYGVTADKLELATQAAVDLAARLGVDLNTAAAQLGGTLQGFTRGLDRVVPGLKDMSDASLKAGKGIEAVADAMRGGAGDAAATFSGQIALLTHSFDELEEATGRWFTQDKLTQVLLAGITGTVAALADEINKLTGAESRQAEESKKLADSAGAAAKSVDALTAAQERNARITSEVGDAISTAAGIAREFGVDLESNLNAQLEANRLKLLAVNQAYADGAITQRDQIALTKALTDQQAELQDQLTLTSRAASDVGTSVGGATDALREHIDAVQDVIAANQRMVNVLRITGEAFDQLRKQAGAAAAIEAALGAGGKLINFGTMIQLPDGSVRLVDATRSSRSLNGGGFTNLDGTPRRF